MGRVTLEIPRILRAGAGGLDRLELEAADLGAVREEIRRRWPVLATHVLTDAGGLRPHVLLLHNDHLLPRDPAVDVSLAPGDRLEIVQAVSGG